LLVSSCSSESTTTSTTKTTAVTSTTSTSTATTTTAVTPKKGGILRVNTSGVTGSLGWPANFTGADVGKAQPALESLLRQNWDGSLYPWLATSYDINYDEPSVTFHLQQGVKFTDGTDFNAEAVKFNYDSVITKKKQAFWKSVSVVDTYTVKIVLTTWSNIAMISFADTGTACVASVKAYQDNGEDWTNTHVVGTGAFKLVSYEKDSKIVWTKNDNYWKPGLPYLDGIELLITSDYQTNKNMLQAGETDSFSAELGKQADELSKLGLDLDVIVQHQATYSLIPDTKNADSPYANKLVREAVEYAINKEAIASGLGYGFWEAPYQIPPKDNSAYNPNYSGTVRKYNPDKARELLKLAGYPNGFKTDLVPGMAKNLDTATAIKSYLDAVGIETTLNNMDTAAYMQYRSGDGWHNALLIEPLAAFGNYNSTWNYYFSPTGTQFRSWTRSEAFLKVFNASILSHDLDISLMRAVNDEIMEECSLIPVHEGGASQPTYKYVKGAGFLQRGFPIYWNAESAWLDK
ncbi:MAG: ABC transporter substrate-binding protein, partial [Burkholderiales bacterium]